MSPLSENRRASRLPSRLVARVERSATHLLPGEARELPAEVTDVSLTGIGLRVGERFDRGAHVRVKLQMDAEHGLAAVGAHWVSEGAVRNCTALDENHFKIGIVLHERNGREREAWQELVTRWSPKNL